MHLCLYVLILFVQKHCVCICDRMRFRGWIRPKRRMNSALIFSNRRLILCMLFWTDVAVVDFILSSCCFIHLKSTKTANLRWTTAHRQCTAQWWSFLVTIQKSVVMFLLTVVNKPQDSQSVSQSIYTEMIVHSLYGI